MFLFLDLAIREFIERDTYCVKRVCIWSYSSPHFSAFGLNMERYRVSLRIQSECAKMQPKITPNMDTFHAVALEE